MNRHCRQYWHRILLSHLQNIKLSIISVAVERTRRTSSLPQAAMSSALLRMPHSVLQWNSFHFGLKSVLADFLVFMEGCAPCLNLDHCSSNAMLWTLKNPCVHAQSSWFHKEVNGNLTKDRAWFPASPRPTVNAFSLSSCHHLSFPLYQFPVAAITNYKHGGLNQQKFILSWFESPKVQNQHRWTKFKVSRGSGRNLSLAP